MNSGKLFEKQWRKSAKDVEGLFYYRFKDSPTSWINNQGKSGLRFTNDNICDVLMFYSPILFLLELKSHAGKSLPISVIRKNQLNGLNEASNYANIKAGLLVFFSSVNKCFFADIKKVYSFIEKSERKSIPISFFEKYGLEIPVKQLRTNYMYDVRYLIGGI